jgi:hypothetical protein
MAGGNPGRKERSQVRTSFSRSEVRSQGLELGNLGPTILHWKGDALGKDLWQP